MGFTKEWFWGSKDVANQKRRAAAVCGFDDGSNETVSCESCQCHHEFAKEPRWPHLLREEEPPNLTQLTNMSRFLSFQQTEIDNNVFLR